MNTSATNRQSSQKAIDTDNSKATQPTSKSCDKPGPTTMNTVDFISFGLTQLRVPTSHREE